MGSRALLARIGGPIALIVVCTATSCVTSTAIVVVPSPSASIDSAARAAYELAGRVAARRGLAPSESPYPTDTTWARCFVKDDLIDPEKFKTDVILCGKVRDREIQFQLQQVMSSSLTPRVDSLRRELLDSLRVQFGEGSVRECERHNERDPRKAGCRPPGDSR